MKFGHDGDRPGGEAEGRAELHPARAARAEGQLDELALALRVDAPEAALARFLLAARHLDEVSAHQSNRNHGWHTHYITSPRPCRGKGACEAGPYLVLVTNPYF
jgi:hypothetical protein